MKRKLDIVKNEDGWTFMETLIVIAIVLILTATVGFIAINSLEKSRVAAAKTQIDSFSTPEGVSPPQRCCVCGCCLLCLAVSELRSVRRRYPHGLHRRSVPGSGSMGKHCR